MSLDKKITCEGKMKLSKFNVVESVEDGILIYNTNSGGILKLDEQYEKKYKALQEEQDIEDEEFKKALCYGKMIVNQEEGDETKKLFLENIMSRFGGNSIGLTIAPTMTCNFRCPYCYEKGKEYVTMNAETIKKMKEYFRSLKEQYKYLSITWYGGEPLVAFDIIKELTEEAYNIFGKDCVMADAVTNGYLLDEDTVLDMQKLNINRIQVTIDGPPEIHNQRRRLPSGEDTFFVILGNLQKALKLYPELSIAVRINVDKTNVSRVDEIEKYLEEYGLLGKVSAYIAPVSNINETCVDGDCLNVKEFALEEIKFLKKNQKEGMKFVRVPAKMVGMCGAVSANSWVIDAKGDFYKCWDDVSAIPERVGSLYEETQKINKKLLDWLSYTIEDDEECVQCPYLPVCMGGCPNYRIKNKGKNCHSIKENANQIVRLVYDMAKQKENSND